MFLNYRNCFICALFILVVAGTTVPIKTHCKSGSPEFFNCVLNDPQFQLTAGINAKSGKINDALTVPVTGPSSRMSARLEFYKWPRNYTSGTYDVPYLFDPATPYAQSDLPYFSYAMDNIARGSNIRFVPYQGPDKHASYIFFSGADPYGCFAFLGYLGQGPANNGRVTVNVARENFSLNPPSYGCVTSYILQHELLHALGFDHEHQRMDASNYVYIEDGAPAGATLGADDGINYHDTPYDMASIMHYDSYISPKDPKYTNVVKSRPITLTSCDWNALNTDYPGAKKPPTCIPHVVDNVCEALPSCPYSMAECVEICHYLCGNDNQGMGSYCRIMDGAPFPVDAMSPQTKYPMAPPLPKKHPKFPAPPPPPYKARA